MHGPVPAKVVGRNFGNWRHSSRCCRPPAPPTNRDDCRPAKRCSRRSGQVDRRRLLCHWRARHRRLDLWRSVQGPTSFDTRPSVARCDRRRGCDRQLRSSIHASSWSFTNTSTRVNLAERSSAHRRQSVPRGNSRRQSQHRVPADTSRHVVCPGSPLNSADR